MSPTRWCLPASVARGGAVLVLGACTGSGGSGSVDTAAQTPISGLLATIHPDVGSVVVVSWRQEVPSPSTVQYSIDADVWLETPRSAAEVGDHELLLLGVPFDHDVSWRLAYEGEDGPQQTALSMTHTDPLPEAIRQVVSVSGDPSVWDPEMPYVLMSLAGANVGTGNPIVIIDRQGRVVWAFVLPRAKVSLHPRVSYDGTALLLDHGSFWAEGFDGGASSQILRAHIDGSIEATYDTPGLHHPFTQLADGSLVWGAFQGRDETLDILGPDGVLETLWDCGAYLQSLGVEDYCGSNTVYWDESRDTFLYSLYTVDTIVEIDHGTGALLNTYGHLDGAWSFQPADSAFWWQHGPTVLDDGNLLLSCQLEGQDTLVMREYARDQSAQTLTQVWTWGQDDPVIGEAMGEAHRLASGNTLHNYGSGARLREVTPDGVVVWDVIWDMEFIGRSEPVADLYAFLP